MSCLVTGAAGFIGSNLAESLARKGHHVVGIDSFTDYYPRQMKIDNLGSLMKMNRFHLVQGDINSVDLQKLLKGVDYVFHLAAQPGVRPSWGSNFKRYADDNILATQRLLEACKRVPIRRFVYASSSSVYGDAERFPTPENATPRPTSPYGATKLAAEHLCALYHRNFGVPVVTLRYFTVYGPRQRPDMAFNRFISGMLKGERIEVYGDGSQSRDFTFVGDTVRATIVAKETGAGTIYNVGSGKTWSVIQAISIIEEEVGKKAKVLHLRREVGDMTRTAADTSRIEGELGFSARTDLRDGLRQQVAWQGKRQVWAQATIKRAERERNRVGKSGSGTKGTGSQD